jgi:hypothetical protein
VLRQDLEQPQVVLVEVADPELGQDDHARDLALVQQRHEDHRLLDDVRRPGHIECPRITAGIGHDERLSALCHEARDALPDAQAQPLGGLAGVFVGEASESDRLERHAVLCDDVDASVVVVDDLARLETDGRRDLLERAEARELGRDQLDRLQLAGPERGVGLQTGRLDTLGQLASVEASHRSVTEREVLACAAVEAEGAAVRVGYGHEQHVAAVAARPEEARWSGIPPLGGPDVSHPLEHSFAVVEVQIGARVGARGGADRFEESFDALAALSGHRRRPPGHSWRARWPPAPTSRPERGSVRRGPSSPRPGR